jgi:phosphatidylethanolamine N-methyltransferase
MASEGSRQRGRPTEKPLHLDNADDARQRVLQLNDDEDKDHSNGGEKRTYGRTPDGTGRSPPVNTSNGCFNGTRRN